MQEARQAQAEHEEQQQAALREAARQAALTRELGLTPEDELAGALEMSIAISRTGGDPIEPAAVADLSTAPNQPADTLYYDAAEIYQAVTPTQAEQSSAETAAGMFPELADVYETLSEEDIQLIAAFSERLQTATVEDFNIVETADMAGQLEGPIEAEQPANITHGKDEADATDETKIVNLTDAEGIPEDITRLVEQIAEYVSMEEIEEYSETHALLDDVSRSLGQLEAALNIESDSETESIQIIQGAVRAEAAGSTVQIFDRTGLNSIEIPNAGEVTEAEATLKHDLQKLYQHIGLEYSEKAIDLLIAQLVSSAGSNPQIETFLSPEYENGTIASQPETNRASSSNNDMHESLNWFFAKLKHLKRQTNWAHAIGRQALSSFNGMLNLQQAA